MATKKLAKKAGLAVFAKHMENYKPADPYYEVYIDKKGREKRRRVSREAALDGAHYAYICTATILTISSVYLPVVAPPSGTYN